jgi:hypothetical protein
LEDISAVDRGDSAATPTASGGRHGALDAVDLLLVEDQLGLLLVLLLSSLFIRKLRLVSIAGRRRHRPAAGG